MAKIALSEFVPEIALAIGDAPDHIVEHYVLQACNEFCERSQILQRQIFIDVQSGVQDYQLDVDDDERIVSLQRVCSMNHCYEHVVDPLGDKPCHTGCTFHSHAVWFVPPDTIDIRPVPRHDADRAIWVEVAVAPARDTCQVDRLLYDRYHEDIVNGALARLYLAKATPWHDKTLAEYHRTLFSQGVSAAGVDRLTGFMRGRINMKGRRII